MTEMISKLKQQNDELLESCNEDKSKAQAACELISELKFQNEELKTSNAKIHKKLSLQSLHYCKLEVKNGSLLKKEQNLVKELESCTNDSKSQIQELQQLLNAAAEKVNILNTKVIQYSIICDYIYICNILYIYICISFIGKGMVNDI